MADTKILQAILNKVSSLESVVADGFRELRGRFDKTDERIDSLGMQIANLEDDAPTVGEFDRLEKRVDKLEKQFASA